MTGDESRLKRAERRGRRIGIVIFATILTSFTLVCSYQILRQVWAPESVPVQVGCRDGMRGLIAAVRRARQAAAAESGGELAALTRFRSALEPEWMARAALGKRCASEAGAEHTLNEIDRLRYAEEHAVRYEAVDLARRRQRVQALEQALERERPPGDETRALPMP